jgi:hypothetical protein
MESDAWQQCLLMCPHILEDLLKTQDYAKISKYYHYMDELAMIRRSTGSVLTYSDDRPPISLRKLMPVYEVKTAFLEYREEEAVEAQWVHRSYARYVNTMFLQV